MQPCFSRTVLCASVLLWGQLMFSEASAALQCHGGSSEPATVKAATLKGTSLSAQLDEPGHQGLRSVSPSAGAHTIGFGIVDVPDQLGASAFAVTNVALPPVRKPSKWAFLAAGMVGLLGVRRGTAAIRG